MLYTIIAIDDILADSNSYNNYAVAPRSTDPYDYIRMGYSLDVPDIHGGHSCVNYNCNFSGAVSGVVHNTPDK